MTDEQLEAISKACAEATRGEWLRTTTPAPLRYGGPEGFIVLCDGPIAHVERMEDADFLTLAHRAVPALVDEVRRLRAEREAWAIEELHGPGRVAKVRAEAYEKAAREGAEQLQRFADAVMDAQWAEGRGHLEETGCPWCRAGPYSGEDQHEEGCIVLEAAAIRALKG